MRTVKLKVARIGNSRGVRLPAESLRRYRIGEVVLMEERSEGILLRPVGSATVKLTWEETARAMAASAEDWGEWGVTESDGLEALPWPKERHGRVAERAPGYRARPRARGRR